MARLAATTATFCCLCGAQLPKTRIGDLCSTHDLIVPPAPIRIPTPGDADALQVRLTHSIVTESGNRRYAGKDEAGNRIIFERILTAAGGRRVTEN